MILARFIELLIRGFLSSVAVNLIVPQASLYARLTAAVALAVMASLPQSHEHKEQHA